MPGQLILHHHLQPGSLWHTSKLRKNDIECKIVVAEVRSKTSPANIHRVCTFTDHIGVWLDLSGNLGLKINWIFDTFAEAAEKNTFAKAA